MAKGERGWSQGERWGLVWLAGGLQENCRQKHGQRKEKLMSGLVPRPRERRRTSLRTVAPAIRVECCDLLLTQRGAICPPGAAEPHSRCILRRPSTVAARAARYLAGMTHPSPHRARCASPPSPAAPSPCASNPACPAPRAWRCCSSPAGAARATCSQRVAGR